MSEDYRLQERLDTSSTEAMVGIPRENREELKETIDAISPEVIISDTRRKTDMEQLAWDGMKMLLQPHDEVCPKCNGTGKTARDQDCRTCCGEGTLYKPPSERMVELALKPKFPNLNINVYAELDGMSPKEILQSIKDM